MWSNLAREQLAGRNINIVMQYVPSHVGIRGNEQADAEAQQARMLPCSTPLPYATAKATIKRQHRHTATARQYTEVYVRGTGFPRRPTLKIPGVTRKGATTIRQLRVQRHPLVYDFTEDGSPQCDTCGVPCTIHHLLRACELSTQHRAALGSSRIDTLLHDRPVQVLRYLWDAGLLEGGSRELHQHRGDQHKRYTMNVALRQQRQGRRT